MANTLPIRKNIRLAEYDYSSNGYYFVTICTNDRQMLLGDIVEDAIYNFSRVDLTPLGVCVDQTIQIANKADIKIDKYVIMPNHMHMIIVLCNSAGDRGRSPLQQVVRNIKSYVTKSVGFSPWQKSFHDRVIRSESEYQKIWQYIDNNPANWVDDCYYTNHQEAIQ